MSKKSLLFGKEAEQIACSFLIQKDFSIIEQNYRTKFGEIDIIANHENYLVFIEVKARHSTRKGIPKEAVNFSKQKKIINTANYYLKQKGILNTKVRFDVVSILSLNNKLEFELIQNAFQGV